MNDYRQNISSHFVNDTNHNLYYFVLDSRLPWGTFDHPHKITQSGALWMVCAILAVVMAIAWGAAS